MTSSLPSTYQPGLDPLDSIRRCVPRFLVSGVESSPQAWQDPMLTTLLGVRCGDRAKPTRSPHRVPIRLERHSPLVHQLYLSGERGGAILGRQLIGISFTLAGLPGRTRNPPCGEVKLGNDKWRDPVLGVTINPNECDRPRCLDVKCPRQRSSNDGPRPINGISEGLGFQGAPCPVPGREVLAIR